MTKKQRAIFNYMVNFTTENFYQPSMREVADEFGFRSTNGVMFHLQPLVAMGLIDLAGGSSRAIKFHRRTPIGDDE